VTVFSPDDLALVKGGPAERRDYLDELLAMLSPRYDAARADFERVLKQRNALLRNGVRGTEARTTLDVFDEQLVHAGSALIRGRLQLVERLEPALRTRYNELAAASTEVAATYETEWADEISLDGVHDGFRAALASRRGAELDRGITLVGPHRDELRLTVAGFDARQQASQGEQRTLALALRLAGHDVVTALTDTAPALLLDDVFSELDATRAAALVHNLPRGQTLLTTTGVLPPGISVERWLHVEDGGVA
jgi:DNA replication and repair protein RecF